MHSLYKLLAYESIVDVKLTPDERAEIELQYQMRKDLITERVKAEDPDADIPCISVDYDATALNELENTAAVYRGLPVVGVANENIAALISAKSKNQALLEAYNQVIKSVHTDNLMRDLASLGISAYNVVSDDSIINSVNLEAIPLVTKDNEIAINQEAVNNGIVTQDKSSVVLSQLPLVKARLVALNDCIIDKMKSENEQDGLSKTIFPLSLSNINDSYFQQLIILTSKLNRAFFVQLEKIYEDCKVYAEGADYSSLKQLLDDIATSYNELCKEVEIKYELKNNSNSLLVNEIVSRVSAEEAISTDVKKGYDNALISLVSRIRNIINQTKRIADINLCRIVKIIDKMPSVGKSISDKLQITVYQGVNGCYILKVLGSGETYSTYLVDLSSLENPVIKSYNGQISENDRIGDISDILKNSKFTIDCDYISVYGINEYISKDLSTFRECLSAIKKYITITGNDVDIIKVVKDLCEIYARYANRSSSHTHFVISEFDKIENPINDFFKFSELCMGLIEHIRFALIEDKQEIGYEDVMYTPNSNYDVNLLDALKNIHNELTHSHFEDVQQLTQQEIDNFRLDDNIRQRLVIVQIVSLVIDYTFGLFINSIETSFNLTAECCELDYKTKVIANLVTMKETN